MKKISYFIPLMLISGYVLAATWFNDFGTNTDYAKLFEEVVSKVKQDYVEVIDDKEIYQAAVEGVLSSLDPHSTFFDATEFGDIQETIKGEFGGLGVEIGHRNGQTIIVSPYENGPAFKVGLKPGDVIIMIEDEIIINQNLESIIRKLRGAVGSRVKISIYRHKTGETLDFNIKREIIKIPSVRVSIVDKKTLYINISAFIDGTVQQIIEGVESTLAKHKMSQADINGIILDLRWNPGGLLDQALEVSRLFLNKGQRIVSIKSRKKREDFSSTKKNYFSHQKPLIVLVNNGSASASEIVAGAIQDHKLGIILGTKTFGKGSVQEIVPINDSAIKLTVARYYTPNGHSIQATGIIPDLEVEEQIVKIEEINIQVKGIGESSLPKHLPNKEEIITALIKNNKIDIDTNSVRDYQLIRAIDLIKSINILSNHAIIPIEEVT